MITVLVQCNGEAKEAKEQIISLLGQDFPLTAKKLYNLMKKRYMTGSTYHAVYKQLKELVRKGVVVKNGQEYRLSGEWIKSASIFTENVKLAYGINELHAQTTDGIESACMACTSYGTMKKLMDNYKKRFLAGINPEKGNRILWLGDHLWAPLVSPTDLVGVLKDIKGKKVRYCLAVRGNTKLDKIIRNLYKKGGVSRIKTGAGIGGNETIVIYNDTMFYIVFPEESVGFLNRLFEESGSMSEFDYAKFNEKFVSCKMPFMIFVIKKPEIVNYYAEKIESALKAA